MVKEALFNLLRGHTEDANVFDGFAGVGGIGLEAISRGAAHCTFVEKDRAVAEVLKQNIASLREEDRCRVVTGDALARSSLAGVERPLHLAFLDPPFPMMEAGPQRVRVLEQAARLVSMLDDTGFFVLRTPWPMTNKKNNEDIDLSIEGADGPETHPYGAMALHLYMRTRDAHIGDDASDD